ncbi:ras GTPase-activating protein nGAP-like [Lethenteron reissneri]|uniref:ras GTPase-activating protein nGAP-like n=1 Tax=Lethenteron reissneri TaxID=7753 RepID=UPI002AB6A624|nr:ras GTPase-activating protein nGAP-like [Lethenteron reissneri]
MQKSLNKMVSEMAATSVPNIAVMLEQDRKDSSGTLKALSKFMICSNVYDWFKHKPRSSSYDYLPNVHNNPDLDHDSSKDKNNSRRIKNDFKLWILEARDLPGTGEYFCKISFSADQPCAQTSSKRTMPDVFWGENFEFSDLSAVKQVLVSLYKGKDKHRKGKSSYMGLVSIPLGSGTKWHQFVEQWYTFSTPNLGKGKGAVPTVRIKWRHQQLSILPMERYKEFAEFLSASCLPLCLLLEPALGVKSKEELARALVRFLHTAGRVTGFLTELVMEEVQRCDPDVLFRQNTLASKSVEQFLRLVGQPYLHQVLGAFLQGIISRRTKCEVDPSKCTQSELQHNQKALVQLCSEATRSIMASMGVFPAELRDVFSSWRRLCEARGPSGDQRAAHQRVALPALPVPGHHVPQPLRAEPGVPRRAHGAHPHAHRQGRPESRQLLQVRDQRGLHDVHERLPGTRVEPHEAVPGGDVPGERQSERPRLAGHRGPGPGALQLALPAQRHHPAQAG